METSIIKLEKEIVLKKVDYDSFIKRILEFTRTVVRRKSKISRGGHRSY